MLRDIGQDRIVLTLRSDRYGPGELDLTEFARYELLPLGDDRAEELVRQWLGPEADRFLNQIPLRSITEIVENPLILMIALKVYLDPVRRNLPIRREELYRQFVDISLAASIATFPVLLAPTLSY